MTDRAQPKPENLTAETTLHSSGLKSSSRVSRVTTTRSAGNVIFALLLLCFLGLLLFQHLRAGLSFPTPWPDEAHFLWQSAAVAETNSLFAPEINSERIVYWMPPGFMIFQGLIFKLSGVSLVAARWTSFLSLVCSFSLFAMLMRSYSMKLLSLVLIGVFFTHAAFIACGNIGRMESLLILLVLIAFLALRNGHILLGLSILLASPLVHPNGFYFLIAALVYAFFDGTIATNGIIQEIRKPINASALLIACSFWLVYLTHVSGDFESFRADIDFQLQRKAGVRVLGNLLENRQLLFEGMACLCLVIQFLRRSPTGWLLALSLPSWCIYRVGHELWYEVFDGLAYLCLTLFLVQALRDYLNEKFKRTPGANRIMVLLAACLLVVWAGDARVVHARHTLSMEFNWNRLSYNSGVPYWLESDAQQISKRIRSLTKETERPKVQFLPRADALLFPKLRAEGIRIFSPVFNEETADFIYIHRSRRLPRYWSMLERRDLLGVGIASLRSTAPVLRRNKTEIWFLIQGNTQN